MEKVFDDPRHQAIYEAGQRRIDAVRAELPADGTIPIPFRCYLCDHMRFDFSFKTGDGLPICRGCLCLDGLGLEGQCPTAS